MKEHIETIPLLKAFRANEECPFCYLEREAEQHAISFILGSAYMEDDIREQTDRTGFCRHHYKMMYEYGNRLGSALILSTHLKQLNQELQKELSEFSIEKSSFLERRKRPDAQAEAKTPLAAWLRRKERSCYVCDHFHEIYNRYLEVFFDLYRKDPEFRTLVENGKGYCLGHFSDLVECASLRLTDHEKNAFFSMLFSQMQENLTRLTDEVSWFVDKNDYRNKDKDWGNSADSVQRCMQKCAGGYPADPVYKQKP